MKKMGLAYNKRNTKNWSEPCSPFILGGSQIEKDNECST